MNWTMTGDEKGKNVNAKFIIAYLHMEKVLHTNIPILHASHATVSETCFGQIPAVR